MKLNTYYESFLRKDIFPHDQSAVDLIMDIYENDEKERHYIYGVIESYIQGLLSRYKTWEILMRNEINKYKHAYNCMAKTLDDEYKIKMEGGK